MPLRLHDKIIGAFNVESENLAAFTEEDRQFAEIFANHIALALHILDLLVMERASTGETVTGTVQGEIREPLDDIVEHANWLQSASQKDPALKDHVDRILSDCAAIREKVKDAAAGPQHIIGAERALAEMTIDPYLAGKHVLVADDEPKIRQHHPRHPARQGLPRDGLLQEAMTDAIQNPLDSTELGLRASIAAISGRPGFYKLAVTLNVNELHLEHVKNRWVGDIDFGTHFSLALDFKGSYETIRISLTEDRLRQTLKDGFVFRREINSQPGELRVVVQDRGTGSIGSVRVPLGAQ